MVCASLFLTTDWSFPSVPADSATACWRSSEGEIRQRDLIVLAQAQGPDEHVAQLTDVAGPRIAHERVHGAFRTPDSLAPHAVEDIAHDQGDVLDALAQGRKVEGHGVDAVVQVFAERPRRDHFFEVAVGRGDKPEIHGPGLRRSEPGEGFLLQHPEQLDLCVQGKISTSSRNRVP